MTDHERMLADGRLGVCCTAVALDNMSTLQRERALEDGSHYAHCATVALGGLTTEEQERALTDANWYVRCAVIALGNLTTEEQERALTDESWYVRCAVIALEKWNLDEDGDVCRVARFFAKHRSAEFIVPDLDRKIWERIRDFPERLEMGEWHSPECEATHCRAGHAIDLLGDLGYELEEAVGPYVAGMVIYRASRPGVPVPNFFASNKEALRDIERCARYGR